MNIKTTISLFLFAFIVQFNYAQTEHSTRKNKNHIDNNDTRYLGLGYNLSMGLSGTLSDNHVLNIYQTKRPTKKKYIMPYQGLGLGYFRTHVMGVGGENPSPGYDVYHKNVSIYYGLNFGIDGRYIGAEFSTDIGLIFITPPSILAGQFRAHFSLNSGRLFKNSQLSIGMPFAYPVIYFGPYGGAPFMGALNVSYRMTINKNGH